MNERPILSGSVSNVYASSEESEEAEDYDLYKVSSDAASAFQDALGGKLNEDGEEEEEEEEEAGEGAPQAKKLIFAGQGSDTGPRTGNVCTYLGFSDDTKTKGAVQNFFSSQRTQASATFSYKQFRRMKGIIEGGDATGGYGFQSYANYGRLLADLGLDTTGQTGSKLARGAAGYALFGSYILAASVPFLFEYILKFLNFLNPFILLGEASYKLAESSSSLSELGKWTVNLWELLQDLSLFVIIPIFFALSFGIALITHQPGGSSKIGNSFFSFFIRLVFITIAIPIAGSIYTSFLGEIGNMAGFGTKSADSVVYSELVDFQGWVSNTRLAPPDGVQFKWDTQKEYAHIPKGSIRKVAMDINKLAGHSPGEDNSFSHGDSSFVVPTGFGTTDLSKVEYTTGKFDKSGSNTETIALLRRFASADVYSSSAYASEVNADRQTLMSKEDDREKYEKMFLEGEVANGEPYSLHKSSIFGNGTLGSDDSAAGTWVYKSDTSASSIAKSGNLVSGKGGLSTIGMYNYLNSKFNDSEVTVYSSKKSTSEYVKDSHYSVSAIGSGIWKPLWYAQTLVTLLCMAIIGLIYALSMVITGIRQGGRMLAAIPGGALGSLASIGKFVAAFFVMIADILITIVLYSVFCELLQVVNEATSNIIPSAVGSAALNISGGTDMPLMVGFSPLNFIGVLFSILLILYVTILAIRNRTVFIRSVDEVVSGSLGRMLGTKKGIGRGSKGSLLGAAAGTAAGVAAGKMISDKLGGNGKDGMGSGGAKGDPGSDGGGGGGSGGLAAAVGASADDGSAGAGGSGGVGADGASAVSGENRLLSDGGGVEVASGGDGGNGVDGASGSDGATANVAAIDNLDNVDAETGAVSGSAGEAELKSATGSVADGGKGGASSSTTNTATATSASGGKSGSGGNVRKASANTSGEVDGSSASAGTAAGGTLSDKSPGKMPERSPKSAAFYADADKVAAGIKDTSPGAAGREGFRSESVV